jgi:hypothetical protein
MLVAQPTGPGVQAAVGKLGAGKLSCAPADGRDATRLSIS